jgi:hypothetical protein
MLLASAAAVAVPAAGFAQTVLRTDRDYCDRLSGIYEHYIGRSFASPYGDVRRGNLAAQVAVTQCKDGDVASAIGVLERELTNNKITLPPRG